jgi:hypothetical protein
MQSSRKQTEQGKRQRFTRERDRQGHKGETGDGKADKKSTIPFHEIVCASPHHKLPDGGEAPGQDQSDQGGTGGDHCSADSFPSTTGMPLT